MNRVLDPITRITTTTRGCTKASDTSRRPSGTTVATSRSSKRASAACRKRRYDGRWKPTEGQGRPMTERISARFPVNGSGAVQRPPVDRASKRCGYRNAATMRGQSRPHKRQKTLLEQGPSCDCVKEKLDRHLFLTQTVRIWDFAESHRSVPGTLVRYRALSVALMRLV